MIRRIGDSDTQINIGDEMEVILEYLINAIGYHDLIIPLLLVALPSHLMLILQVNLQEQQHIKLW